MIEDHFKELLHRYTSDQQQAALLWTAIKAHYAEKGRHYHTLAHLGHLYQQLQGCKSHIEDWDTVLFALYYHDIIYKPLRGDNEEQSAAFAVKQLKTLLYPLHKTERCHAHIIATKGHQVSNDADTNLFTDADLSILGSDASTYLQYATNVRKEYAVYPDFIYKKGRVKVLHHFLDMERIFKTSFFYERFEKQARLNIQTEIKQLS